MSKAKDFIWSWGLSIDILKKIGASKTNLSSDELRGMILIHTAFGKNFTWSDIYRFLMKQDYKKFDEAAIHNAKVSVTRFVGKLIKAGMVIKSKDEVDKRISHYHFTTTAIKFIESFEQEFNKA